MSDALTTSPFAHAVGLAVVQFLWQGTVLAGIYALLVALSRRRSAQTRYLIGCLTLLLMVLALSWTCAAYVRQFSLPVPAISSPAHAQPTVTGAPVATTPITTIQSLAAVLNWVETRWPAVFVIWSLGVLILTAQLLRGWLLVSRIRRTSSRPAAIDWETRLAALAARLGIRRPLRLVESARIDAPGVIGWIRPLIVVPASALAGLTPEQVDAIFAHELAHVRRHDYLVNALQSVAEVVLFYHPAVWWISHRIRVEREHCCDDLAVEISGDRVAYAEALTSLEEHRGVPAFVLGARGGDLLARVRRVVGVRETTTRPLAGWMAMVAVIAIVGVTLGARGYVIQEPAPIVEVAPPAAVIPPTPIVAETPHATATSGVHVIVAPRTQQPPDTSAQQSGSITGVVIDPQGGRLPGATVTAISADRSQAASTTTNATGRFAFTGVSPGPYDVKVLLPGFKALSALVQVGQGETRLDFRLELGGVTETITVAGPLGAPLGVQPTPAPAPQPGSPPDLLNLAPTRSEPAAPVDVAEGPIRIGGSIKEPRKIHDVKPVYPDDALAAGVQGVVIIEAVIARDGSVTDARLLRSVPMLDQAALDAVRQWRFTPTLLNGVPVEVIMTVTVNFTGR